MSETSLAMMPWFPRDFLASTIGWTFVQRSLYRSLLDAQWELEALPDDEDELTRIAGASPSEFAAAWPRVKAKFELGPDGKLRNMKCEEHRTVALEKVEKKRAAGKIGGQASVRARTKHRLSNRSTDAQANGQANGQAKFNPPSPSPSPSFEEEEKKTAAPPLPPPPDNLNHKAWEEWQSYRREKRIAPYKPTSVSKAMEFLARFEPDEQQSIVDYSVRNAYRGLFDPRKGNGTHQQNTKPRLSAVERVYAATAELCGDDGQVPGQGRMGVEIDGGALRAGVSVGLRR